MKSKSVPIIAILGMFAFMSLFLSQMSTELQTSFAAKGGEPGCGVDSKGDITSKGKCVKEPKQDDGNDGDSSDIISGDDVHSGVNEDHQSCQVCSGN